MNDIDEWSVRLMRGLIKIHKRLEKLFCEYVCWFGISIAGRNIVGQIYSQGCRADNIIEKFTYRIKKMQTVFWIVMKVCKKYTAHAGQPSRNDQGCTILMHNHKIESRNLKKKERRWLSLFETFCKDGMTYLLSPIFSNIPKKDQLAV